MTSSSLSGTDWLLEIVLMVLLVLTMFHAFRLERALGVLRRDRAALEELVTGFNASARQAEDGIERLRVAADGAGRQIARHVDQARGLKSDLEFLSSRGEKIADRLAVVIRQARPSDLAGSGQDTTVEAETQVLAQAGSLSPVGREQALDQETRLRSQAEKDLLRALRLAR
ncbi:DUF6468 domain-containing protein [Lichenicola sp.]|uniref:DUF6468 domain-containing protein n=1 Tax=Lichenicola sp. TaxID=2804529 RepID=UPI003B00BB92